MYLKYDPQIKSYYDMIESRLKGLDDFIDDNDREESIAEKMITYKRSIRFLKLC